MTRTWKVLLGLAAAGFTVAGPLLVASVPLAPAGPAAGTAALAFDAPAAAPDVVVAANPVTATFTAPAAEPAAAPYAASAVAAPQVNDGTGGEPWAGAYDSGSLPAWRWGSIELDIDASGGFAGIGGIFKGAQVQVIEMVFALANFVWQVLLFVIAMAFGTDKLIGIAAGAINAGAAFFGQRLFYIAPAFVAVALWQIVRAYLGNKKGDKGGGPAAALRTTVKFAVMIGLLVVMTNASVDAVNNHGPDDQMQPGTYPWAADRILNVANLVIDPIAGPVLSGRDGKSIDQQIADKVDTGTDSTVNPQGATGCDAYTGVIYDTYLSGPDAQRTLVVMSRLWEATFYESWKSAAFGTPTKYTNINGQVVSSDIPARVMCHYAEAEADTPVDVQQAIAATAYPGAIAPYTSLESVPAVFGPFGATRNEQKRRAMTAWAACTFENGAWKGHPNYDGAWESWKDTNIFTKNGICGDVMVKSEKDKALKDDAYKGLFIWGSKVRDAVDKGDAREREALKAARNFGASYSGANMSVRLQGAFVALIVAILFGWALGMIAVGMSISMLIAVACLIFALPVAFALAAVGKGQMAKPLVKMTISGLLAKGFFTIVLCVLIILSGVMQNLIGALSGGINQGGAGMANVVVLLRGVAPLVSLWLLRKILKSIGMGDIFTASGALTFGTAAAMAATGDKRLQAMALNKKGNNRVQDGLRKMPGMKRLDNMAPTRDNWGSEGRTRRAKEADTREARITERLKNRGNDTRLKRMLNSIDKQRLPEGTAGKLRDLAGKVAKYGAIGAALVLTGGTAGVALAGGLGAAGVMRGRRARAIGDTVDVDNADEVDVDTSGTGDGRTRGKDAEPARDQIRRDVADRVEATRDAVQAGADPSATPEMIEEQARIAAVTEMMDTFTQATLNMRGVVLTDAEIDGIRISAGEKLGFAARDIVVASNGVFVPIGLDRERLQAEGTDEQLGHYVNWLPDHERKPLPGETADDYAARIFTIGVARGWVSPDGTSVDVLAANGIDTQTEAGRTRVARWQAGGSDDLLDTLQTGGGAADEIRLVEAARAAVAERTAEPLRRAAAGAADQMRERAAAAARAAEEAVVQAAEEAAAAAAAAAEAAAQQQKLDEAAAKAADEARMVATITQLLQSQRAQGSSDDVLRETAGQLADAFDRLDASQSQLVSHLGNTLADALDRHLSAQARTNNDFASRVEQVFGSGVETIAGLVGGVESVLAEFRAGLRDIDSTMAAVADAVARTNAESVQSVNELTEAVRKQSANVPTSYGRATGQADARSTVTGSGIGPIPES